MLVCKRDQWGIDSQGLLKITEDTRPGVPNLILAGGFILRQKTEGEDQYPWRCCKHSVGHRSCWVCSRTGAPRQQAGAQCSSVLVKGPWRNQTVLLPTGPPTLSMLPLLTAAAWAQWNVAYWAGTRKPGFSQTEKSPIYSEAVGQAKDSEIWL